MDNDKLNNAIDNFVEAVADAATMLKHDLAGTLPPAPVKPLDKLFIVFNADGSIFATLQDETRAIEFERAEPGRMYYEYELA